MPNTPDNKLDWRPTPTIIDLALKTLKEREAEQAGYQKLNGYIDEVRRLLGFNSGISKESPKASFEKALFQGIELTGNVPQHNELQANIRLLRIDSADSDKTQARVMISLDLYPAGLKPNEEQPLESLDYTLGNNLLIENNKIDKEGKGSKITPSDPAFEQDLLNIEVIINTAKNILQGLSL